MSQSNGFMSQFTKNFDSPTKDRHRPTPKRPTLAHSIKGSSWIPRDTSNSAGWGSNQKSSQNFSRRDLITETYDEFRSTMTSNLSNLSKNAKKSLLTSPSNSSTDDFKYIYNFLNKNNYLELHSKKKMNELIYKKLVSTTKANLDKCKQKHLSDSRASFDKHAQNAHKDPKDTKDTNSLAGLS